MAHSQRVRRVWAVYVAYCALSSAANLGLFLFILWMRVHRSEIWPGWIGQETYDAAPLYVFEIIEVCGLAIGAFFCVGDIAVVFIPKNDKGWIVGIVNIALGLGSGLFTPICLWLIFQWLGKGFREEFRGQPTPESVAGP